MPRDVHVGDTWTCDERTIDTWSTKGGAVGEGHGTTRLKASSRYKYLRRTPLEVPSIGRFDSALLEIANRDGGLRRVWVDLNAPWCALKNDRILVGEVVGTDWLVERSAAPILKAAAAPQGNVTLGKWALGMLLALGAMVLLTTAIVWYAGKRSHLR